MSLLGISWLFFRRNWDESTQLTSLLPPLTCFCAEHPRLSQALSFIKQRWMLSCLTEWDPPSITQCILCFKNICFIKNKFAWYLYEAYSENKYCFAVKKSIKILYRILLLSDSTFFKLFFHIFAAIIVCGFSVDRGSHGTCAKWQSRGCARDMRRRYFLSE